ncbi:MAG: hypothetical protein KDE33_29150, partial [Bacteroidetes bacterium]|nr:hypothetical protein [Bacteroidota bacterium]
MARRIESQFRLLPLEKITVGPYDNFDPFVSDGNRFLLFSRKIQLTPRVYYQKIGSEKTINLIDDRFDTRSPSISIGGDKMAFISYHRKSSGEVCFKKIDLEERSFDCIEAEESGDVQNPFWLNQQKLGYLTRYIYENRNELKIYDLHTKKIEIIKSGSIYSPRSDTAGQRIVYLEKMALKQQWGHSEANKIV